MSQPSGKATIVDPVQVPRINGLGDPEATLLQYDFEHDIAARLATRAGLKEHTPAGLIAFDLSTHQGMSPLSVVTTRSAQALAQAFEQGGAQAFAPPPPPSPLEFAGLDALARDAAGAA